MVVLVMPEKNVKQIKAGEKADQSNKIWTPYNDTGYDMRIKYLAWQMNLFNEAFHQQAETQIKCAVGVGLLADFIMMRTLRNKARYLQHVMSFKNKNAHRDKSDRQWAWDVMKFFCVNFAETCL